MKHRFYSKGFTVIEVMLFLAISGLMFAGLMVGISGGVNRERYNDAVTSLYDFAQGQYNSVDNVSTNRDEAYGCTQSGKVSPSGGQAVGTSECSIVGRYISSQDGKTILVRPIYATADITKLESSLPENFTQRQLIEAMELVIAPLELTADQQEYSLAWDTSVYTDKADVTNGDFSLVMIRLPTNNLIRSYGVPRHDTSIINIINDAESDRSPLLMCVNPDGLVSSPARGVRIMPLAANANGAQLTRGGECS